MPTQLRKTILRKEKFMTNVLFITNFACSVWKMRRLCSLRVVLHTKEESGFSKKMEINNWPQCAQVMLKDLIEKEIRRDP